MTLRTDSAKELATLQRLARLGLRPGTRFDPAWLSAAQREAVEAAFGEARQESEQHIQESRLDRNGWRFNAELMEDVNDYVRQGYYGLTALGAPIPYQSHAAAFGFVDTNGTPLTGASRYTITFDINDLPPVTEFWELPLYDQNGYFVDNEIDRYAINSFMYERGELHMADGKLVIYIQHDKPTDPTQAQNWLPAPSGRFRFAFRYYGPMSGLLDGSYNMPGVVCRAP